MIPENYSERLAQFTNNETDRTALLHLVEEIVATQTSELREDRDRAGQYLQIATTALISLDINGNIIFINQRACELLEYTEEELPGQNWFEMCLPARKRDEVWQAFKQVIDGNLEPALYYENQVLTKSGQLRLMAWYNSYHTDPETGKITGTFSSGRDISHQRAMEDALKQNELRYRQMFYNNSAIKLVIDPQEGNIIDANQAACGFYGYPHDELTEMNITDISSCNFEEWTAVRKKQSGENQRYSCQHRLASGDIRDVEIFSNSINIDNSVYQYSIIIDVTEREKTRHALQVKELQFRRVVHQFPHGMILMFDSDLYCTIARGQLMFDEIDSYEELEGQYLPDVLPERIWKAVKESYTDALAGKSSRHSFQNENHYFLVQIEPLYDDENMLIGGLHIFQDITHIQQSRRLLQETREQLDTILNGIADGVAVVSTTEKILYANETAARILGYSSVEALMEGTQHNFSIRHEPFNDTGALLAFEDQALYRALQGESPPPQRIVFKNPQSDNEYWTDTKATPIFDDDGVLRFVVVILNDITRARQAEELRIEALHEKAQVETLRTYIASTTHDLSQPLSVINTAVYMIDRLTEDDAVRQYSGKIMKQSVMIQSILQDIKQISLLDSISKLQFMTVDINQIINQIADYGTEKVEGNQQQFHYEFTPGQKFVIGNPQYIERAVMQLLQNAMDYSPPGSTITLRCLEKEQDVIVEIEDNGTGMATEHLGRIFDRFYRVDKSRTTRARSGTGLGLSIARRIMELHGGNIEVESEMGEGSLFRLSFPLKPEE